MFSEDSYMPVWARVGLTVVTAVMLMPFVFIVAIPILVVAPATLPFLLMAFAGDVHEEGEALDDVVHPERPPHRYRVSLVGGFAPA